MKVPIKDDIFIEFPEKVVEEEVTVIPEIVEYNGLGILADILLNPKIVLSKRIIQEMLAVVIQHLSTSRKTSEQSSETIITTDATEEACKTLQEINEILTPKEG
jgi:hypothetical protein